MTTDLRPDVDLNVAEIRKATGWIMVFSVGLIILGTLAIILPVVASAIFTSAIGWIAIISGVVMLVESFQSRPIRGFWLHFLLGIFYIIAGIYILFNVGAAMLALTFTFGVLFIVEGIYTIIMAFTNRAGHRMSWLMVLNGVITLILGIMVLNRFPVSALWLIGLYVGISLLMSGMATLTAALAVRKTYSSPI